MTIVIVVCSIALVALSALLAIGLSRAAARGDEGMNDDIGMLRVRARKRGAAQAPTQRS
jgi:hypothetical protein